MNIVDLIIEENSGRLTNPALSEPGKELSYGELLDAVKETAEILSGQGIKEFDRVAMYFGDGIDYVIISLAILKLDAVMVPISPSYAFNDVSTAIESIDISWLISQEAIDDYDNVSVPCPAMLSSEFLLHSRKSASDLPSEYYDCGPAFVRFSSGTTGASKGVLLSHTAIAERTDAADKCLSITENDTVLWMLSMSFHFVVTILLFLRRGALIVLCSREFPGDLLAQLRNGNGTFIYASPFHYKLMSELPEINQENVSNVRMAVSTAMSLSDDIAASFRSRFGFDLSQAYGIIEVGLPFIETVKEGHTNGAVGRIGSDYEIKISEDGEILLRGKGMFSAYFEPWQTLKSIDPEGWFHTGDIGRLDKDSRLFIDGRKKELINFVGMKIFPAEVEDVLNRHESIKEAQVYAIADDTYGQLPAARVLLAHAAFDEKAVRRFCYSILPSYKVPKVFEVVDNIDKTHSGKIKRK